MNPSTTALIRKSLYSYQMAVLFAFATVLSIALPAESQQTCDSSYSSSYGERPALTRRTVELPNLGVTVAIPDNYRTMQRQDGSVQILHPSAFDMIQCIAQGGRGGHGIYFERINLVEDDLTVDLREQAIQLVGGGRTSVAPQVIPYEQDGLRGYVVGSDRGYSSSFLGTIPGQNQLLQVSAGCDCQVGVDAVLDLLPYVAVMD